VNDVRRLPDRRSVPFDRAGSAHGDAAGGDRQDDAGRAGDAQRRGPRVHVWHTSRTMPLPGALALIVIVPILLAVGVATIGLFAAGMAGLLTAPRLLRRRGRAEGGAAGERPQHRPAIVLERDDYRRMD
jgi:hypothetical protein